jgi:hypothetical protein
VQLLDVTAKGVVESGLRLALALLAVGFARATWTTPRPTGELAGSGRAVIPVLVNVKYVAML